MNRELFSSLTIEGAPEASRPLLEKVEAHFGFVPYLTAKMANSPVLLRLCELLTKNQQLMLPSFKKREYELNRNDRVSNGEYIQSNTWT